jgi:hypothetical protein
MTPEEIATHIDAEIQSCDDFTPEEKVRHGFGASDIRAPGRLDDAKKMVAFRERDDARQAQKPKLVIRDNGAGKPEKGANCSVSGGFVLTLPFETLRGKAHGEGKMLSNGLSERTPIIPRSVNNRAKLTNNPRRLPISGRTALGRRIHDLADGYAAALGGWASLSDMMAGNVRKAAELVALAETMRADALRDGNVDPLVLVRLDGAANRAVRALQLDVPRDPQPQTIEQFIAGFKAGEAQRARQPAGRRRTPARPRNATCGRTRPGQRASDDGEA